MVHNTLGDGRCTFRTVALVIHELVPLDDTQEEIETDRLRVITMTAMRTNARVLVEDTYNWNVAEELDRRIKRMERTTEYVQSSEVITLTVALNRPITVVRPLEPLLRPAPHTPAGTCITCVSDVRIQETRALTDHLNRLRQS
jgi:hypothetical protein